MNRQMIAGLALLLCGSAANAADEEGSYNNPEAFSCPAVLQAIGDERAARARQQAPAPDTNYSVNYERIWNWVSGWLTAYNYLTPDTYRLVTPSAFTVWVEDFCRQNPSQNTAYVLAEYARLNNDKRVRKAPQR